MTFQYFHKKYLALKYIINLIRKTNKYVKIISIQVPTNNYKQYVRTMLNDVSQRTGTGQQ